MKRLLASAMLALFSFGMDRLIATQLFETNVVASLLSPSGATALTSALLALLFLLNRVALYVALPGVCCAALARLALRQWLTIRSREQTEASAAAPRAPAESAST